MNSTQRSRAIAFAGICQAATLVHRTANGLSTREGDSAPLIRSIFMTDPDSVDDVYGDDADLQLGVTAALDMLARPSPAMMPVLKYVMSLLDIEARLRRHPDMGRTLHDGIAALTPRPDETESFAALSALYQQTISHMERRIHVTGIGELLKREDIAAKIRSLLLAGIRSAWLWHQLGGRRWHLLLRRSTIRDAMLLLMKPTMIH